MCGKETLYDRAVSVYLRDYYIEGAGQLCKECYEKTYNNEKRREDELCSI